MFLILIQYKKSFEIVAQYVETHRAYLDKGYEKNLLITSGPKVPRTGGVMLSQAKTREELDEFIAQDPFVLNDVADYEVIEFTPVKYHQDFSGFV